MTRTPLHLTAAATVVVAVALTAGCGGGAGPDPQADERAAREVAQRAIDGLLMARDPDGACAVLTAAARVGAARLVPPLAVRMGATPSCRLGILAIGTFWTHAMSGDVQATAGAVTVTGDDAVVTIDYAGAIRDRLGVADARLRLARVDGRWLVTNEDPDGLVAATG